MDARVHTGPVSLLLKVMGWGAAEPHPFIMAPCNPVAASSSPAAGMGALASEGTWDGRDLPGLS
jgi:hypothetical protein